MSKTLIQRINRRTKIYAAILLTGIAAVFIRIVFVNLERSNPIISFVSEWDKYGKPVIAKKIKTADIPIYTKFTVIRHSDTSASGFVTADIKEKLKQNQKVYSTPDDNTPCGKILKIGRELDINSGMFPVKVKCNTPVSLSNSIMIVFAQTQTLQKTLVVPNNIIDISRNHYYLWKIDNQKAKRIHVSIGLRNGYGTIINEGINEGDILVLNGQNTLKENDMVNIINKIEEPQINNTVKER